MFAGQWLAVGQRRVFGRTKHGGHTGLEQFALKAAQHLGRAQAQKGQHLGIGMHTAPAAQVFDRQQVTLALQHGRQQTGQHQLQVSVGRQG